MQRMLAYWRLARPLQLVAVLAVALTGMMMAVANGAAFDVGTAFWSVLVLLLVAASIHYANEYADVETDKLTTRTPFSGGSGILAAGNIQRETVLKMAWSLLLTGILLHGCGLVAGASHLIACAVLLLGAWGGWMYSLPPLRLAWRGYGEITNALLGGMLLLLYGYTSIGATDYAIVIIYSVPFTILVFLNLLATTWADRDADYQVGKMTLAAQLDRSQLRHIFRVGMLLYLGSLFLLSPEPLLLLLFLPTLPLLFYSYRHYTRRPSPHPIVMMMVTALVGQGVGWLLLALG